MPDNSKKILIVDDERDITSALKLGLERHGFDVDVYNDPLVALDEIDSKDYDLAIFDIRMPGIDGFELYRRFRRLDGETQVCFFTAFDVYENEFRRMFPEVHVAALFKKPMTIADLSERLNKILSGQKVGVK